MIIAADPKLAQYYEATERSLPLKFSENGLAEYVRFVKNRDQPIHNWFHFKEGFSSKLLYQIDIELKPLSNPKSVFVDPFCGSGTLVLAGDLEYRWKGQIVGIEINPLLSFVANTKARWREFNPTILLQSTREVLSQRLRIDRPTDSWPTLSTFHNREIFEPDRVSALLDAVDRVSKLECLEKDLMLLGIASAAEKLGYFRKDGRALRILRKETELFPRRNLIVDEVLEGIWTSYADDLRHLLEIKGNAIRTGKVIQGDGITLSPLSDLGIRHDNVDLFAYSPPYLNHIDYTEVYKVELWLLGYVVSQTEMLEIRKRTLRSHASYSFEVDATGLPLEIIEIIGLLANEIEATGKDWHRQFHRTALGYFQDMKVSLMNQYKFLKTGGRAVCVVANSSHGSGSHRVPVATDLLIAQLAKHVGFDVEKILIARRTQRRDAPNPYLRESVLVLKKI